MSSEPIQHSVSAGAFGTVPRMLKGLSRFGTGLKFFFGTNGSIASAAMPEQRFPLSHCCQMYQAEKCISVEK